MYKYISNKQLKLEEFKSDFELSLNPMNRWVQLNSITPWDDLIHMHMNCMIHQIRSGIIT